MERIRLFSAKRVGEDLAAGRIAAGEQSLYLTASFLIWMIPAYLFIFAAPRTSDPSFFWAVWLIELAVLVLFCIVGIGYCLRQCRVDPSRHFLLDFSCLNAPVSLTTLAAVWGCFHLLAETLPWFASPRAHDLLRLVASAAAVFIVFLRIGKQMDRVSLLRSRSPAA